MWRKVDATNQVLALDSHTLVGMKDRHGLILKGSSRGRHREDFPHGMESERDNCKYYQRYDMETKERKGYFALHVK